MDRRIKVVIAKIEHDPSCQTAELAVLVHLSKSRLRHLFKQETGTALGQYLKRVRLTRTALLLRTTFLTVKEIVNKLGISSNAHFVRDFKQIYGMTPTLYRLQNRSNLKQSTTKKFPAAFDIN